MSYGRVPTIMRELVEDWLGGVFAVRARVSDVKNSVRGALTVTPAIICIALGKICNAFIHYYSWWWFGNLPVWFEGGRPSSDCWHASNLSEGFQET